MAKAAHLQSRYSDVACVDRARHERRRKRVVARLSTRMTMPGQLPEAHSDQHKAHHRLMRFSLTSIKAKSPKSSNMITEHIPIIGATAGNSH